MKKGIHKKFESQVSIFLTLSGFIISWENKNFKCSKIVKVSIKFHANHNNKKFLNKVFLFIHLSTVTRTLIEQLIKIVEKS